MSIDFQKLDFRKRMNLNRWGGWPAVAWEKDSQALVICVGGNGMVLEHVGAHVDYEVTEMSCDIEENGLEPPHDGVFIWTGKYVVTSGGHWEDPLEYESEAAGEFRELTLEEMQALAKGDAVLEEQPLNPDFCEKLHDAIKANDVPTIRECLKVIVANDLDHDDCYVFVAEAAGWEASSESITKFEKLLEIL